MLIIDCEKKTKKNHKYMSKLQYISQGLRVSFSHTDICIYSFIKFIWYDQHQLEIVTITEQKSTGAYHLHWYETEIGFSIASSCHRLPHKN